MPRPTQRQFSAGGIVFKKDNSQILYLLRLPKANPEYQSKIVWTFPKGWLDDADDGKSPGPLATGQKKATPEQVQQAALREVEEELGVKARIIQRLNTIKFFFRDLNHQQILKFVTYYLMEYVKDLPQGYSGETETTTWFTYEKAKQELAYPNEKSLLASAHQILSSSLQPTLK